MHTVFPAHTWPTTAENTRCTSDEGDVWGEGISEAVLCFKHTEPPLTASLPDMQKNEEVEKENVVRMMHMAEKGQ